MDTKLIKQYGEQICCYRLRYTRQKKRMQYEDFDKQLIQLDKEEKKLRKQQRNLGWELLNPPIQRGWIRHFVLREDVARGKYAVFFNNILKKINTYEYSWKKDFKKKKRKRGRKIYVLKPQYLLKPYEYQFSKMEFTESEKQFFKEVWEVDWRKQPVKRYEFVEPWRFVLKVRVNMIDKVRIKDIELESRLNEIDNYFKKNCLRGRLINLLHGNNRWNWRRRVVKAKEKYEYQHKSLNQILDSIKCGQR
jgi:hypothetical protein